MFSYLDINFLKLHRFHTIYITRIVYLVLHRRAIIIKLKGALKYFEKKVSERKEVTSETCAETLLNHAFISRTNSNNCAGTPNFQLLSVAI